MRRWYEGRPDKPDIAKDAAPAAGAALVLTTLWREFFGLIKLNLLFLITCIPIITIPAAVTAMNRITITMVRDQNYFLMHDYMESFKKEFVKSLSGFVFIALMAVFAFSIWFYYSLGQHNSFFLLFAAFSGCLFLWSYVASLYFFPMLAWVDLPVKTYLKNAMLLVFKNLKRSALALVAALLFLFLGIGMLPYTSPYCLLIMFSFTSLMVGFAVYPVLEKQTMVHEEEEEIVTSGLRSSTIGSWDDEEDN